MESQPQIPEFMNNLENFQPCDQVVKSTWLVVLMLYIPINKFSVIFGILF